MQFRAVCLEFWLLVVLHLLELHTFYVCTNIWTLIELSSPYIYSVHIFSSRLRFVHRHCDHRYCNLQFVITCCTCTKIYAYSMYGVLHFNCCSYNSFNHLLFLYVCLALIFSPYTWIPVQCLCYYLWGSIGSGEVGNRAGRKGEHAFG